MSIDSDTANNVSVSADQETRSLRLAPPRTRIPAGLWKRFAATFADYIICTVLSLPLQFVLGIVIGFLGATNNELMVLGSYLIWFMLIFFYYGWFYHNRGATPGKTLMHLRVSYADTGTHLTYWRAFWRETVGKTLSACILFIGFLMAGFRRDRRALHDLLFNTQVTYEPQ